MKVLVNVFVHALCALNVYWWQRKKRLKMTAAVYASEKAAKRKIHSTRTHWFDENPFSVSYNFKWLYFIWIIPTLQRVVSTLGLSFSPLPTNGATQWRRWQWNFHACKWNKCIKYYKKQNELHHGYPVPWAGVAQFMSVWALLLFRLASLGARRTSLRQMRANATSMA